MSERIEGISADDLSGVVAMPASMDSQQSQDETSEMDAVREKLGQAGGVLADLARGVEEYALTSSTDVDRSISMNMGSNLDLVSQ